VLRFSVWWSCVNNSPGTLYFQIGYYEIGAFRFMLSVLLFEIFGVSDLCCCLCRADCQWGLSFGSLQVSRYFATHDVQYYFQVNDQYVKNKLKVVLFPFLHKVSLTSLLSFSGV
jgi:hypothetical protein